MRIHPLSFAVILALATPLAHAQDLNSVPCVENTVGGGIIYGIGGGKNSAPFSGVAHSTLEQRLYDGNVIRTQMEVHQARDSAGRTREERQEGCAIGDDGQMHPRLSLSISDPVAKEFLSWTVNDPLGRKVVRITHFPALPAVRNPPSTPTPEQQQLRAEQQRLAQLQAQNLRNQIVSEQLGTRTLNGVEATGTRDTQTIPPGKEGNDMPLVIINENWRSRTLGLITLFAIRDDPRTGKSTFEYTELNLGEPDPSLFAPPAGYTIEETHPGQAA